MEAAAIVALATVVAVLSVLVVGLLRSHAEILRALHDLGIGEDGESTSRSSSAAGFQVRPGVSLPRTEGATSAVSDLVGVDPWGNPLSVAVAGVEHRTLLVFLSTGCLTCQDFWQAFADPSTLGLRPDVRPVIVVKDQAHESASRLQELAPAAVPVVSTNDAWEHYSIPVAPYFVLVDGTEERVVGEGAAATWEQVRGLLDQALSDLDASGGSWQRGRNPSAVRLDQLAEEELRRAGIGPGDPSLYGDDPGAARAASPERDGA